VDDAPTPWITFYRRSRDRTEPACGVRMTRFGLSFALAVAVLDQISKWWILADVMNPPTVIPVTSFFNLVLVWNRGVSFGILNQSSTWIPWLLSALAAAICVGLFIWLRRAESRRLAASLGLIIGGALGNLIDRVRFGAVVDFLDVHAAGYHWPAFNVADAAITIGVVVLLIDSLIAGREERKVDSPQ
jgi:signal peptidase II